MENRVAYLAWQDEGGGYSFSRADILSMTLDEMDRYIDIADKRRKARVKAIKEANRKARAKAKR